MYSFKSVEHTGLQNLAQTCIDIGARCSRYLEWPKVNSSDTPIATDEDVNIKAALKNEIQVPLELMKDFVPIFDSLEFSITPIIHIVVPSYYAMIQSKCHSNSLDSNIFGFALLAITDKFYQTTRLKSIKDGLLLIWQMMSKTIEWISLITREFVDCSTTAIEKPRTDESFGLFAKLPNSSSEPSKSSVKDELSVELAQYNKLSFLTTPALANPSLLFLEF
ncbi:unnamed protein product [Adineta ricciae]|uniref:Uncharacterized protein n=1 Tax=Adineta ricciae TaxID=249248 RepID=A0A814MSF9_ADIRI|nr:unnamed protein product [Adineta ricciae]